MSDYLRPETLEQALDALSARALTIIAGGTDHYPARLGGAHPEDLLDVTAIGALRGVEERGDDFRIGALATWGDIIAAPLPPGFVGRKQAARAPGRAGPAGFKGVEVGDSGQTRRLQGSNHVFTTGGEW